MSSYPFRLYGDDTSDWFEPPHPFEVQLSREPDEDERKRMAAVWVARGPRRGAAWLWSGRFFLMHVDAGHYGRTMGIAGKVLAAVHEICPIVDVSCWGTRSGGGAWTTWSVSRQARPDPGPDHPNLARDVLFWARDVDPDVPAPTADPVFSEELKTLRQSDALSGLWAAVEKHEALDLVEIEGEPPQAAPVSWPEEHAHQVDFSEPEPDVALGWPIPAVVRQLPGWKTQLTYLWKGAVHHFEARNDFKNSAFDVASGRVWFQVRESLHELNLETGEDRAVWKRERSDHSFWGMTVVGSGDHRMLVVATAVRLVCFSIAGDDIASTSVTKRKHPSISGAFGGRVLAVRGHAGLSFFIPAAGKLQQVLALPKVKPFFGSDRADRLFLHMAERTFELTGLLPLVSAKEAARDKKAARKKTSGKKSGRAKLALEPTEAPPHVPHTGVPAGAFELPYASAAGAVYMVPLGGKTCQLGHVDAEGKTRLLRSKDFRNVGVSPSGKNAQAVTSTNLISFEVGGKGKAADQPLARAYDTVAIAGGDRQCVVIQGKKMLWFSIGESGDAELIALGKPSGSATASTPLLLEDSGALLLPRGEKGLEVYLRDQESITKVAKVDVPVDSVVARANGVTAHHSQHGTTYRVENLESAIEAGRDKLRRDREKGKLKAFPFPRPRPDALPALETKSSVPGASTIQGRTLQGPDGIEVAFGGDARRGGKPWLKVQRAGAKPIAFEGFEASWGNVRQLSSGASGALYIAGDDGVFCARWESLGQGGWLAGIGAARGVAELAPDLLAVLQHKSLALFARGGDGGWQEVASRKLKALDRIGALDGTDLCYVVESFRRTFLFRVERSGGQATVSPICEVDGAGALRKHEGRVFVDTGDEAEVLEVIGLTV